MVPDAEVTGPPGNLVAKRHQTTRHTGHYTPAGVSGRGHMQFNIAGKIERALNGGADLGRKLDYRHENVAKC